MEAQIENGCIVCNEIITNPICPDCLSERMRYWLDENNSKLGKDVKGFHLEGPTKCIFCGTGMAICAHCFSRDIYDYLEENDRNLAAEFAARFDFELRKELV